MASVLATPLGCLLLAQQGGPISTHHTNWSDLCCVFDLFFSNPAVFRSISIDIHDRVSARFVHGTLSGLRRERRKCHSSTPAEPTNPRSVRWPLCEAGRAPVSSSRTLSCVRARKRHGNLPRHARTGRPRGSETWAVDCHGETAVVSP